MDVLSRQLQQVAYRWQVRELSSDMERARPKPGSLPSNADAG
jgi:hypothetical protein